MKLSVVVPALDEARRLPALLDDLQTLRAPPPAGIGPVEVVVADGGSSDGTPELARAAGARVVAGWTGRGTQLRAGADVASGDWLLFLHADCRLDDVAIRALRGFLASAGPDDFAHFAFRLDGHGAFHRFIELGQALRERWLGLVYGDQGLLVSRSLYDRVGGYPDWPLMEDVEMVRRLERRGRRVPLAASLVTSARRYEEEGGLRRWLRNVALMSLFQAGIDPTRLIRWYRPRRTAPETSAGPSGPRHVRTGRLVGVFAKAPVPGRVKTRLAADVGDRRAAEIYRALGGGTVDALRGGPYRLVVSFAPRDGESRRLVRAWLGPEGIELRAQSGGDLGMRMAAFFDEALDEAGEAILVGSDIPGIDRRTVTTAFERLVRHDVVLGPASDGGYWLVGLSRRCPELFRGIAWSTDRVLAETVARAESAGLSVSLLDEKRDVDTAEDLRAALGPGTGIAHRSPFER